MLSFLRRSSAKSAGPSAVCLFAGRIDMARVVQGGAGGLPRVLALESYERRGDDIDALKRLAGKYHLERTPCCTLLNQGEYQLHQFDLPSGMPDGDLRTTLRERLADAIDQPIANCTHDVLRIPTAQFSPGRTQSAYVVAAGNAHVAPVVQRFHRAKIALAVIDIPEMAQRNIAHLAETPDRALAFLAFEPEGGLLTFTCNGELYMTRRIDIGLRALLTDDLDRRSALFDRIGLEVQRSLDNFDRQYGFLPVNRVLLGPYSEAQALQGYLSDYLATTVDVLDLAQVLDISHIPELKAPARQAQCLLSLGAALRHEEAADA